MNVSTPHRSLNFKSITPLSKISQSSDYFTCITNKIKEFFYQKKFCDITLIANDDTYKVDAHKMILCATSEYFLAMFGGSMREAGEDHVTLQIDGPSLESVINYIYSNSIELTTENVEDLLKAANLLELGPLKTLCCEFIAKHLDSSNCLGIALFAEQYSLEKLYKVSEIFVCDNFLKVCKDDEFLKLDVYQLCKFLSSSDLKIDSEEDAFRCLLSWIDYDRLNREESMSKLLHHIRFPLLAPEFISGIIEPTCKSIECERLICKAYKWHLLPECRSSLYTKKQTELRNFNDFLMAISGWSSNGGTLKVALYYPTLNKWLYQNKISGLEIGRKDFASTSFKGKLIIAGGSLTTSNVLTDRVDCLDLRTFEWTSFAPLNTKRKQFGMVSLKGYIYAVGGIGDRGALNIVERYDPATKQWTFVASMANSCPILHVSVALDKLCVSTEQEDRYQRFAVKYSHNLYDPETNIWTYNWMVSSDPPIGAGTVSVFMNQFFIAVSRQSITRYNYLLKSTETLSITMSADSSQFKYCIGFGDRMIAYGDNLFQEYNPFSNEWKMMPKLENDQGKVVLVSNR